MLWRLLTEIADQIAIHREMWRTRGMTITARDIGRSIDAWSDSHPDDPLVQLHRATAQLETRRVFGRRPHDA